MRKFGDLLINALCLLIPQKRARRSLRTKLRSYSLWDAQRFRAYEESGVRDDSVLIIESNPTHGETLPGFAKYLLDLGFNVDILMSKRVADEQPFCRIGDERIRIYAGGFGLIERASESIALAQYKYILLNTTTYYGGAEDIGLLDKLPQLRSHPGLLVVEHDLADVEKFGEQKLLDSGRLITLGRFPKSLFVNPHYVGNVNTNPKNQKTRFVIIGSIEAKRKNHKVLINAINKLAKDNVEFEVVIIGIVRHKRQLKGVLDERHVRLAGRLDFPHMYDEVERADFILPLLDPDNKAHERYITTGITGSAQLIYGFTKPCLINRKFAAFYGFDKSNSIIYDDNLANAMSMAISMGMDEYDLMRANLKTLSDSIYQESLTNLKNALASI
jgi:glycosyltransferase involved in cell wall biosynthesis